MKILVVEDNLAIAQTLQLLFLSYSYAVDVVTDGETGWQMAEAYAYDLIVLDVLLPRLDGISLCQQLRAAGYRMPILLLTGQDDSSQKATALNAGADDYVVKPFDPEELVARVQALLRRGQVISPPILTWGQLSIDPSTCKVAYGNYLLSTTPKEYAILEYLLRNPQRILSSRTLLDHVWASFEFPGEEAVRVHIKEIRKKLTAIGAPKDLIKTIYQTGYQLNPLYEAVISNRSDEPSMLLQIAELRSVNQELRITLEELRATQEELYQQNTALAIARHQVEQERHLYQDLFEFAPDGYLVTDPHGIIQQANRMAANLLAMDAPDLVGKSLAIFISRFDRPTFRAQLDRLNPEGLSLASLDVESLDVEPDWEALLQPRTGEPFPVLIAVTSIRNAEHQITGLRWSLRDSRHHKYPKLTLV
ncbi:MAG: response regulator [Leptolyngbyaceae cyanobacterium bins.302]|nr:response regulator [Leptolyngbyaceae cyanobacterium bins.302]